MKCKKSKAQNYSLINRKTQLIIVLTHVSRPQSVSSQNNTSAKTLFKNSSFDVNNIGFFYSWNVYMTWDFLLQNYHFSTQKNDSLFFKSKDELST